MHRMSSFVSKTIGRMLLPNLEKDLARVVNEGIQSSAKMADCFLAPSVYGFEKQVASHGMGRATPAIEQRIGSSSSNVAFEKVHYRVPGRGLFQ